MAFSKLARNAAAPVSGTSVSIAFANAVALPLFTILLAACVGLYRACWHTIPYDALAALLDRHGLRLLAWVLASVMLHELLHSLGFVLAGVSWHDVRLGLHWRSLTPYATTAAPMRANSYRLALALPGLVLGMLPLAIALAFERGALLWYGVIMLGLAIGDALAIWAVRHVAGEAIVIDLADRVGCVVLDPVS